MDSPTKVESFDFADHLARHRHHGSDYNITAIFNEYVLVVYDLNVLRLTEIKTNIDLHDWIWYLDCVRVDMMSIIEDLRCVLSRYD